MFGKAADDVIASFIERKVYWQTKISRESRVASPEPRIGAARSRSGESSEKQVPHRSFAPVPNDISIAPRVWIADPTEEQYLETTTAHLLEVAGQLVAGKGMLWINGEWAEASPALMAHGEKFESAMRAALEELDKKHAFERG